MSHLGMGKDASVTAAGGGRKGLSVASGRRGPSPSSPASDRGRDSTVTSANGGAGGPGATGAARTAGAEHRERSAGVDPLVLGRRIRHLRTGRGLTLADLAGAVGCSSAQLSMVENGRREPRLTLLGDLARALDVSVEALLAEGAPSRRAELEIAVERIVRGPLSAELGLASLRLGRTVPTEALEAIVALHAQIVRMTRRSAAGAEEARRANTRLRADQRDQDNYFPDLEERARGMLDAVGHADGPLSQREVAEIADHLGFTLHLAADLPASARSVTDLRRRRIYLPVEITSWRDPRSLVLQALAADVLDHGEPATYGEYLTQRVQTNYLAAALLLPEDGVVRLLAEARAERRVSVEDLRDAYAVPYETAAHRFTNLATHHLGVRVHFLKVHHTGTVHKVYDNDGMPLPADPLGAVEGQPACRQWAVRRIFAVPDRFSPYYQYTDTPVGTFWETARVQGSRRDGDFAVGLGVPFDQARWFRGRQTERRYTSRCPQPDCCRHPTPEQAERWAGRARPSARPHASLLATLPLGVVGVDPVEVHEFLDRHGG